MWQSFSPSAAFSTFHSIMLSVSGDTAGQLSRSEGNSRDYQPTRLTVFWLDTATEKEEEETEEIRSGKCERRLRACSVLVCCSVGKMQFGGLYIKTKINMFVYTMILKDGNSRMEPEVNTTVHLKFIFSEKSKGINLQQKNVFVLFIWALLKDALCNFPAGWSATRLSPCDIIALPKCFTE
ncbi:hypothetical protein NQD34_009283 [Periophthalmus magnuspinnatus]|nr:hypothetical protein NQD34_009283 [Periophthalmus magnuspinnatus]